MSHFYRLHTVNNVSEKAKLGWRGSYLPSGEPGDYLEFEKLFEEITLDPPWPHCKMYRAPECPHAIIERYEIFRYTGDKPLPDLWVAGACALVSQKVKEIVESFDDFGHQFHAVPVWAII